MKTPVSQHTLWRMDQPGKPLEEEETYPNPARRPVRVPLPEREKPREKPADKPLVKPRVPERVR